MWDILLSRPGLTPRRNDGQISNLYTLCDLPCPDEPENAPAATYKIPDLTPGALPVTLPMSGSYFIDSFETKTNTLGGVGHLVMRQDIDYI